jgi:hypothetical protein
MKVAPLAISQVDWASYIKVCQEVLGYSPTRGLDDAGIDINDPCSFLATLSLDNKPLENLRKAENTAFNHIMFSFIGVMDLETVMTIMAGTQLQCLYRKGRQDHLVIMSGTMDRWFRAIVVGCDPDSELFGFRMIMNQCYLHFSRTGFKEVWGRYEKIDLGDTTFCLKQSNRF